MMGGNFGSAAGAALLIPILIILVLIVFGVGLVVGGLIGLMF